MKKAINYTFYFLITCLTLVACSNSKEKNNQEALAETDVPSDTLAKAERLVSQMIDEIGGKDALKNLYDVEYTHIYETPEGKRDVSKERYIFDGEQTWAEYLERDARMFPDYEGIIVQSNQGDTTTTMIDGEELEDKEMNKKADFLRKNNFYWFAMNFKLLDPGVNLNYEGVRPLNGIDYDIVRVTFDSEIGNVDDKYLLYINPNTHLIDQFLFTVMDNGIEEPLLMKLDYEEINGVKLTTHREYAPANWAGEVTQDVWTQEISKDISFNNGFVSKDLTIE